MKLVRNTTRQPLRVPLAGGKTLHLGPGATGQVSDDSVDRPSFRKLVEQGVLALDGEGPAVSAATSSSTAPRESTHGHHPPTVVMPKGNR